MSSQSSRSTSRPSAAGITKPNKNQQWISTPSAMRMNISLNIYTFKTQTAEMAGFGLLFHWHQSRNSGENFIEFERTFTGILIDLDKA